MKAKKMSYEELEKEVARLKRSCASYKSENTKLRVGLQQLRAKVGSLDNLLSANERTKDELIDENERLRKRTLWTCFKGLFAG